MKLFVILLSIFVSTAAFSQKNIKIETKDTSCVSILRNTYGFESEVHNSDGTYTFLFNEKSKARIATNLATKKENVDYDIK